MPARYLITDRTPLPHLQWALESGIEFIQIREKHLSARQLTAHVEAVLQLPNPHHTRILVNDRLDIALACRAHGVHLRANSISPRLLRNTTPRGFLIAVSCHSIADLEAAEGADFAVLSPIFETPGKGSPLGLRYLAQAVHTSPVPVFALGGVTEERIPTCLRLGAKGVAGIRLFRLPDHSGNDFFTR
jgi:thiamine-phosphate pyrophosphorylase